ncbi:MAG: response regulator [Campylobacterales bacterium]
MKRLFIVEDDVIIARQLERMLIKMGLEVLGIAAGAKEAIEKIRQLRPDLVLMDIRLGKDDGTQIARTLQSERDQPIVYITAHSDPKTLQDALKAKPYGYIIKPFGEDEVRVAVLTALERIGAGEDEGDCEVIDLGEGVFYERTNRQLRRGDQILRLTKKEAKLLSLLSENLDKIVPYEKVEDFIWSQDAVADMTRRTLLWRLKKKLPAGSLETLSGVGYRLVSRGAGK